MIKPKKLAVKRARTGLGLFALESIPANRRIIEYVGDVIDSRERFKRGGRFLFQINDDLFIDGSARSNVARYINHGCEPNAKAYYEGRRIWIWSLHRIEAGQEITIDYGKQYTDEFIPPGGCRCATCLPR